MTVILPPLRTNSAEPFLNIIPGNLPKSMQKIDSYFEGLEKLRGNQRISVEFQCESLLATDDSYSDV